MPQTVMYNCMDLLIQIGQGVQMTKEYLWCMFQKSVALNTAEAEYIAYFDACMEVMWLCTLVSKLFD
jgi:hypothetical protein